jgi:hypothetical protein
MRAVRATPFCFDADARERRRRRTHTTTTTTHASRKYHRARASRYVVVVVVVDRRRCRLSTFVPKRQADTRDRHKNAKNTPRTNDGRRATGRRGSNNNNSGVCGGGFSRMSECQLTVRCDWNGVHRAFIKLAPAIERRKRRSMSHTRSGLSSSSELTTRSSSIVRSL